jgi:phosphoglycolate phosphatase-like HAD superfamily hydrolase
MIKAKAVIFDTDSTLVDTMKRFFDVFNEMLEAQESSPLTWAEFFDRYVADSLYEVAVALKARQRRVRLHQFWMEFLRKYREENPNGKLYPV